MERPPSARPMAAGRPTTSRGPQDSARPPSSAGRRSSTVGRPGSSAGSARPPTAQGENFARPSTGALRGRQPTAAPRNLARPSSRLASGAGAPLNVAHRPVTQQGLAGVRPVTSRGLASRAVQDKSYYMGLIRAKQTELNAEVTRLRKDTDHYNEERQHFLIYEKQAEDLARDIKELQGQLADYNTLIDKINTNADTQSMQDDVSQMAAQNDSDMNAADQLFAERKKKEEEVKHLEQELEREKEEAARMVADMDGSLRTKYAQVKQENEQLLEDLKLLQQEGEELGKKRDDLEDELAVNPVKKEAMTLYQRLTEIEAKRDSIKAELNAEGTPEEQRARLLEKVKKDNEEIASMDRQAAEVRERVEHVHEEMRELDEELENEQSEKNQKYRELRQKEQQMDEFLSTYAQTNSSDTARVETYQKAIGNLLRSISKVIVKQQVATDIDTDIGTSSGQPETDPSAEYQRIQSELNRLQELEHKGAEELVTLKEKVDKMRQELETYSNVDELKRRVEEKKRVYTDEKQSLMETVEGSKAKANQLQRDIDKLKEELNESEFYAQIRNLEQRFQHIEQTNFALREAVEARKAETNIEPVAQMVHSMISEYNQLLIQNLAKAPRL